MRIDVEYNTDRQNRTEQENRKRFSACALCSRKATTVTYLDLFGFLSQNR